MAWSPSPQIREKMNDIVAAYPDRKAACIPLLHAIQDEAGYVPENGVTWVAQELEMPKSQVEGVVTFYSMFSITPLGKYHLELCTNVSCALCGSESLLNEIEKELGIKAGETTGDGLFTLSEVECLATCGMGPAMQVGDTIYEHLTPEKARDIIYELKKGAVRK